MLQYLHQIDLLDLLPALFGQVQIPHAIVAEMDEGTRRNVSLPTLEDISRIKKEEEPMTVKQLISILQTYPEKKHVVFGSSDRGYWDPESIRLQFVDGPAGRLPDWGEYEDASPDNEDAYEVVVICRDD